MWSNNGEKANARTVTKLVQPHKVSYMGGLGHQSYSNSHCSGNNGDYLVLNPGERWDSQQWLEV